MTTVNSNDLRIQNAKNLISNLNGDLPDYDANSYLFIGRPTQWDNDSEPPIPLNNTRDFYDTWYQMMSLKRIFNIDAYHMLPRLEWQSGTTWDMYRHDYSYKKLSSSGASDLYDARFYTLNSQNDVYACLYNGTTPDNPKGVPSTVEPLGQSLEAFYTSDGYQWMYLYTISSSLISGYSTNNYIPIANSVLIPQNGAINTVVIDSRGSGYTSSPSGVTNQIPYYFCNVIGDGSGAVGRVALSEGQIYSIDIVREGRDYTYATLDFVANRVYRTLADLDAKVNGLDPLGDGNFNSTCIISPPGGWGTDLPRELGGTRVGIFCDVTYQDADFNTPISFRQIGILQDPEYTNDAYINNTTLGAHKKINASIQNGKYFAPGETIRQRVLVDGVIREASGVIVGINSTDNTLNYIQDPNIHTDDGVLYPFSGSNDVIGDITGTIAVPLGYNGFIGGTLFVDGYGDSEVQPYSGTFTYLSNIRPVYFSKLQNQKITVIITY